MVHDSRKEEEGFIAVGRLATAIIAIAIAVSQTGCTSAGYVFEHKIGVYSVDAHSESSSMSAKSRPLACAWDSSYCEVK